MDLTPAEWKIMNLLWDESPLSVREITERLRDETGWGRHTIISFLKRMEKKAAIRLDPTVSVHSYYPLFSRAEAQMHETQEMMGRVFSGSLGSLVNSLIPPGRLNAAEQEQLMTLLDKLEEER